NGQIGFPTKKIFFIIDLSLIRFGWVCRIQGSHAEHFTSTFRIGGGDDRGMEVIKFAFVKKGMNRVSQFVADSENRSESIGPESQVGVLPQEFLAVFFG